jgi:hypothetical protein
LLPSDAEARARRYAEQHEITIDFSNPLGHGTDGAVWSTSRKSAIKVFAREDCYERERNCYLRFAQHSLTEIEGCVIPSPLDYSDGLLIVEMQVVSPPYILDFGKAYLDAPPDYTDEVWADYEAQQRELWEADYPRIKSIERQLRRLGIYYLDARPGNIVLPSREPPRG